MSEPLERSNPGPVSKRAKRIIKNLAWAAQNGRLGALSVTDLATGKQAELLIINDFDDGEIAGVIPLGVLFSDPTYDPVEHYDPGNMALPPEYVQRDGTWGLDRPEPQEGD